jgi:arylsulfatase
MLRHDRWKLVVHHGGPATRREHTGELYDLADDPHELTNLWNAPTHATVRAALYERLLDVLVATEDRSAQREAYW